MNSPLVQKLTGVRDLKRILETTVKDLGDHFSADACQILLSNPLDPNVTSICEYRSTGSPITGRSTTLPLVLQGRTFGSLTMSRSNDVTPDELNTMRVVLGELGDIIRLAQINDIVQRDTFRDTFLVEIGNLMTYSLGIGDALFMVVNILGKALNVSRCLFICTDDQQAGWKCFEFWQQDKVQSLQQCYWPSADSSLVAQTLLAKEPIKLFEGQQNSYVSPAQEELQLIGVKSLLGISLRSQVGTHGCVILQQCDYRRAWTRNEIDMVQNVADKVAEALHKLPAEKKAREPIMQLHQRIVETPSSEQSRSAIDVRRALKGALGQQAIPQANKTGQITPPPAPKVQPPKPVPTPPPAPVAPPAPPAPPAPATPATPAAAAAPVATPAAANGPQIPALSAAAPVTPPVTAPASAAPAAPVEPSSTATPAPSPSPSTSPPSPSVPAPAAPLTSAPAQTPPAAATTTSDATGPASPSVPTAPASSSAPPATPAAAEAAPGIASGAASRERAQMQAQEVTGEFHSPQTVAKAGTASDLPKPTISPVRATPPVGTPVPAAPPAAAPPIEDDPYADLDFGDIDIPEAELAAPALEAAPDSPWGAPTQTTPGVAVNQVSPAASFAPDDIAEITHPPVEATPQVQPAQPVEPVQAVEPTADSAPPVQPVEAPGATTAAEAASALAPTAAPAAAPAQADAPAVAPDSVPAPAPATAPAADSEWGNLDSIPTPKGSVDAPAAAGDLSMLDSIPTPSAGAGPAPRGGLGASMMGKARAGAGAGPLKNRLGSTQPPASMTPPAPPPSAPAPEIDEAAAQKKLDSIMSASNETSDYIFATNGLDARMLGRIDGWVSQIEAKDKYANGHARQVAEISCAIAKEMGLDQNAIDTIRQAALVHDLGKMGAAAQILQKPEDDLSDTELLLVMNHPMDGAELLESFPDLKHLAPIVRAHHEEYDGNGFPHGLKGDEIPLAARIVGLANRYHELASPKKSGPGKDPSSVQSDFVENAGKAWDPNVVQSFIQAVLTGKIPSTF